jgi:uncharacterized protein (DUF58 family)
MPLPTRRWLLGLAALGLVALLGFVWPGAWAVLLALDALWVVALLVDWLRVPEVGDIELTRVPPPAFSVGRPMPIRYRWRNLGRRRIRFTLREALPAPLAEGSPPRRALTLEPESVLREDLVVNPVRRGRGEGGRLWLRLQGPMGLAEVPAVRDRPWTATVYPALAAAAVRALPAQQQRRREAGFRNVRRVGEGRIFETLREWVPGDDVRAIDWKATARRGRTMVRQYEDERRQQVMLVIDAGRLLTAEVDGRSRLEAVIDAALRLAYAAVDHDDNVGLLVFADTVQHYVPPARGRRALRGVLDALAVVEGRLVEPDYPSAFTYLAARHRRRALNVVFTDIIDRTASEALVAQAGALRPRHVPLAVTLRDPALERAALRRPATAAEAFERAAAEELLLAREEGLAEMRARGVLVLDVPPARAAEAVVEQYERLKRRGVI